MKTCTRCGESKSSELFAKRSRSLDGLSSWCKSCHSEHSGKKWRESVEFRKRKADNMAAFVKRNQAHVLEYLVKNPCIDCGNADVRVLEFDHRDEGAKRFNIADKLRAYAWERLLAEIEKCDVRCANCHRIRTAEQFDTWRNMA